MDKETLPDAPLIGANGSITITECVSPVTQEGLKFQ